MVRHVPFLLLLLLLRLLLLFFCLVPYSSIEPASTRSISLVTRDSLSETFRAREKRAQDDSILRLANLGHCSPTTFEILGTDEPVGFSIALFERLNEYRHGLKYSTRGARDTTVAFVITGTTEMDKSERLNIFVMYSVDVKLYFWETRQSYQNDRLNILVTYFITCIYI